MRTLPAFVVLVVLTDREAFAHEGHSSPEPWTVCAQKELGQACSWENEAHDLHRGTCRSIGDQLVCVRNRPIELARAESQQPAPPGGPATGCESAPFTVLVAAVLLAIAVAYANGRRKLPFKGEESAAEPGQTGRNG